MRRGDSYWIQNPELIIDGNLARKDVCSNDDFRNFVWHTVLAEKERIESISVNQLAAWTQVDGINTLYFLPNGNKVLFNDDVDRGSCTLYYESMDDCHAERFKQWYNARKAAGKPVLVPLQKIMEGTGKAAQNMPDHGYNR